MKSNLDELEDALGYRFTNRPLLTRALTHSSSANEAFSPETRIGAASTDNERLEFLGDAILGWMVSDWLYNQFHEFNEGQLSLVKNHLVSAVHLVAAAHRLELGRYLQLGRGEETAGGRSKQRLLVNAFEAVLAAVYLDGGVSAARELVGRWAIPDKETVLTLAGSGPPHDYRAELERVARDRKMPRPVYVLILESGPGHARTFTVEVRVGRNYVAAAEGSSKKAASHNAARLVCQMIRESTAETLEFK
jgi:ribonuclease-3